MCVREAERETEREREFCILMNVERVQMKVESRINSVYFSFHLNTTAADFTSLISTSLTMEETIMCEMISCGVTAKIQLSWFTI